MSSSPVYKYIFIGVYLLISLQLFYKVFQASQIVIDEEFHLKQGRYYCLGYFDVVNNLDFYFKILRNKFNHFIFHSLQWDPKITTFPGLYVVSTIFLFPLKICSTFALRLTSLFASVVNVWLIYQIRKTVVQKVRIL